MNAAELMQTKFITADANDTISSLVGMFKKEATCDAVILDNGHFLGLARKRAFLRLRQDITQMKVKNLLIKVPKLKPTTPVEEIPSLMDAADSHILPVVEGERVHGVVHAFAVLNHFRQSFANVKIFELLKHAPITLEENAPLSKAINCLYQKKIDHLPIVDARGKLTGIVSIADIIVKYCCFPPRREPKYGGRLHDSHSLKQPDMGAHLPVKNAATPIVYSLAKEDTVAKALDIMLDKNVCSVVITESGNPVGIITIKDMLNFCSA